MQIFTVFKTFFPQQFPPLFSFQNKYPEYNLLSLAFFLTIIHSTHFVKSRKLLWQMCLCIMYAYQTHKMYSVCFLTALKIYNLTHNSQKCAFCSSHTLLGSESTVIFMADFEFLMVVKACLSCRTVNFLILLPWSCSAKPDVKSTTYYKVKENNCWLSMSIDYTWKMTWSCFENKSNYKAVFVT